MGPTATGVWALDEVEPGVGPQDVVWFPSNLELDVGISDGSNIENALRGSRKPKQKEAAGSCSKMQPGSPRDGL